MCVAGVAVAAVGAVVATFGAGEVVGAAIVAGEEGGSFLAELGIGEGSRFLGASGAVLLGGGGGLTAVASRACSGS